VSASWSLLNLSRIRGARARGQKPCTQPAGRGRAARSGTAHRAQWHTRRALAAAAQCVAAEIDEAAEILRSCWRGGSNRMDYAWRLTPERMRTPAVVVAAVSVMAVAGGCNESPPAAPPTPQPELKDAIQSCTFRQWRLALLKTAITPDRVRKAACFPHSPIPTDEEASRLAHEQTGNLPERTERWNAVSRGLCRWRAQCRDGTKISSTIPAPFHHVHLPSSLHSVPFLAQFDCSFRASDPQSC